MTVTELRSPESLEAQARLWDERDAKNPDGKRLMEIARLWASRMQDRPDWVYVMERDARAAWEAGL